MDSVEIAPTVISFFDSYRSAFERLDPVMIADHFIFPCLVTGDSAVVIPQSIASRDKWIPQLNQLLAGYRTIGVSSARIRNLSVIELSPRIFQATVDWQMLDSAKKPIYDFQATYTLVEGGGNLKITAIAHNEIPKFLELMKKVNSA